MLDLPERAANTLADEKDEVVRVLDGSEARRIGIGVDRFVEVVEVRQLRVEAELVEPELERGAEIAEVVRTVDDTNTRGRAMGEV